MSGNGDSQGRNTQEGRAGFSSTQEGNLRQGKVKKSSFPSQSFDFLSHLFRLLTRHCRLSGLTNKHFSQFRGWEPEISVVTFLERALFLVCRRPPSPSTLTWGREHLSAVTS